MAQGSEVVATVDITGPIGWDDAECLQFADRLNAAKTAGATSITLRINSPGGDVFSAMNMYDHMKACALPIRAEVHGLAASAATVLCMAADVIAMSEHAQFMVHQPFAIMGGNPDEMMNYAAMMVKERDRMFAIYGERCGKPGATVDADHKASVFYDAEAAIAYGFVDEIIKAEDAPEETPEPEEDEEPDEPDETDATENDPEAVADEEAEEEEVDEDTTDEDEEDEQPTASARTRLLNLIRRTERACARVLGHKSEEIPANIPAKPQKRTQNAPVALRQAQAKLSRLEAENRGLRAQVAGMKAAATTQEQLVANLVDRKVTERMAALGVPAETLPSAQEAVPAPSAVKKPESRAEFLKMSVDERMAALAAYPDEVKKFLS